ncbi:hypothetical protein C8Q70DRAFT_1011720 [Cubamyces menziesii]|nr:hypothetical protein C8Q70DRAFT_1011720 [Cubamyces menziesii]
MHFCNYCAITRDEKPLFQCGRCKAHMYCSRECQKADWQKHKFICETNTAFFNHIEEQSNSLAGLMHRRTLVDGISLSEYNERIRKWVRFHNTTIMAVTTYALRLPEDETRARRYVLYIKLGPRPQAEHQGAAGKYFRVVDAEVLTCTEAAKRPSPWPESLEQLKIVQDAEEREGKGTVAVAMVECPPLAIQIVPFGQIKDMEGGKVYEGWKSFLMKWVEQGKKLRIPL